MNQLTFTALTITIFSYLFETPVSQDIISRFYSPSRGLFRYNLMKKLHLIGLSINGMCAGGQ